MLFQTDVVQVVVDTDLAELLRISINFDCTPSTVTSYHTIVLRKSSMDRDLILIFNVCDFQRSPPLRFGQQITGHNSRIYSSFVI